MNEEDHDILVKMATQLEMLLKLFDEERKKTAIAIAEVKKDVIAAHSRIDSEIRFRTFATGVFASVAIIITVVTFILKLTGKI